MSGIDFLAIGLPALVGGTLVAFATQRTFANRARPRLSKGYRIIHLRLRDWLIGRNLVRIPGACLSDSMRPWIFGETVGALTLLALWSLDRTPKGTIFAAAIGAAIAVGTAWMGLRAASRQALASIHRDLAVACYLLSLLLESGMGASSALRETAAAVPRGPLARELAELVNARSLGRSPVDAVDRAIQRVPLEDYRLFLNQLRQGERLGIGLSGSLRGISEKVLEGQDHRAETAAQQAAVKMLVPLVCFIFPAVFLIILSPVLLEIWWGLAR